MSDHGFERVDGFADPKTHSRGEMTVTSTTVTTNDAALRAKDGIGRENSADRP